MAQPGGGPTTQDEKSKTVVFPPRATPKVDCARLGKLATTPVEGQPAASSLGSPSSCEEGKPKTKAQVQATSQSDPGGKRVSSRKQRGHFWEASKQSTKRDQPARSTFGGSRDGKAGTIKPIESSRSGSGRGAAVAPAPAPAPGPRSDEGPGGAHNVHTQVLARKNSGYGSGQPTFRSRKQSMRISGSVMQSAGSFKRDSQDRRGSAGRRESTRASFQRPGSFQSRRGSSSKTTEVPKDAETEEHDSVADDDGEDKRSSNLSAACTDMRILCARCAGCDPAERCTWSAVKHELMEATIDSEGIFNSIWELFIILLVLWNAVWIPISVGYSPNWPVTILNYVIDGLFWLDLILQFFVTFYDDFGGVVNNRRAIMKRYLNKWFWIDIVAVFPFEIVLPAQDGTSELINGIKCLRLVRIVKLYKYMDKFKFANLWRMVRLFLSLGLLCHFLGCFWGFVGKQATGQCDQWTHFEGYDEEEGGWNVPRNGTGSGTEVTLYCSWLTSNGRGNLNWERLYLRAFYWALTTVVTVGYGDISPITAAETWYVMLVMMIGSGMHAYIFSNFVTYLHKIDHDENEHANKLDDVLEQMRYLQLPHPMQARIIQYYEYVNRCHKGLDSGDGKSHFFTQLPRPIHLGLAEFLHLSMVQAVPLFNGCSPGFFRGVVTNLISLVCIPDEYIVHKGDMALAMYFITKGSVLVLAEHKGKQLGRLTEGSHFGDTAILEAKLRTASIVAESYCDLYQLQAADMDELLTGFPQDRRKVNRNANKFFDVKRTTVAAMEKGSS